MNIRRILIFSLILSFALTTVSCRSMKIKHNRKKDAREIQKKKRQREKEAQAKYQSKVEYHASTQTPETRKRMKRQFNESQRYHGHKKEFFLKRWWKKVFGPSKRRTSPGLG